MPDQQFLYEQLNAVSGMGFLKQAEPTPEAMPTL